MARFTNINKYVVTWQCEHIYTRCKYIQGSLLEEANSTYNWLHIICIFTAGRDQHHADFNIVTLCSQRVISWLYV